MEEDDKAVNTLNLQLMSRMLLSQFVRT